MVRLIQKIAKLFSSNLILIIIGLFLVIIYCLVGKREGMDTMIKGKRGYDPNLSHEPGEDLEDYNELRSDEDEIAKKMYGIGEYKKVHILAPNTAQYGKKDLAGTPFVENIPLAALPNLGDKDPWTYEKIMQAQKPAGEECEDSVTGIFERCGVAPAKSKCIDMA